MNDKLKCKDCIWLDTKNKSKAGLCECLNTNIKHTRLGHLKYPTNPACVRGFEGFDGQTIEHAPKRTYEQGYADAKAKYLDADAYNEGLADGRADEQKRFIKIFADFFGDEPCNYNCMDEFTDNEWCECHCGKSEHTVLECWEHAINSGWLEQLKEQK